MRLGSTKKKCVKRGKKGIKKEEKNSFTSKFHFHIKTDNKSEQLSRVIKREKINQNKKLPLIYKTCKKRLMTSIGVGSDIELQLFWIHQNQSTCCV